MAASCAEAMENTDGIVQMISEIRVANVTYRAKAQATDKIRKQHVDKAWAERNKVVAAAL